MEGRLRPRSPRGSRLCSLVILFPVSGEAETGYPVSAMMGREDLFEDRMSSRCTRKGPPALSCCPGAQLEARGGLWLGVVRISLESWFR
jgi:hypothetical protein